MDAHMITLRLPGRHPIRRNQGSGVVSQQLQQDSRHRKPARKRLHI